MKSQKNNYEQKKILKSSNFAEMNKRKGQKIKLLSHSVFSQKQFIDITTQNCAFYTTSLDIVSVSRPDPCNGKV